MGVTQRRKTFLRNALNALRISVSFTPLTRLFTESLRRSLGDDVYGDPTRITRRSGVEVQ